MPKTMLGKWAGGLLVAFLVFFIALIVGRNFMRLMLGTPLIWMLGMCAMVTGIATFVAAVVSLIRFKDRSFVVILATIIGSLATLIFIAELVEGIVWHITH